MKTLLLSFLLAGSFVAIGQPFSLSIGGGIANYGGDLQSKPLDLDQARWVVSLGAHYDLSTHFTLRADFNYGSVGADDKKSGARGRIRRNLDFRTEIAELALTGEYNLLDLFEKRWTPYAFAGVGIYHFNPYTFDRQGNKVMLAPLRTEGQGVPAFPDRKPYKLTQLNIPAGVGVKYALSDDISLAGEFGIRKLFTDYLDDVSTTFVDENTLFTHYGPRSVEFAFRGDELDHNPYAYPREGAQRGSPEYKDYYYFMQVKMLFRLQWFSGGNGSPRGMGCPTRW